MEALTELCDLIASNPSLFSDKLSWISSRCPSSLNQHRLTRSQLNSLLSLARFLSLSPTSSPPQPLIDFLRSPPPPPPFWPHSFSIPLFFSSLFSYLASALRSNPDLASHFYSLLGPTLLSASASYSTSPVSRAFLTAAAKNSAPILPDHASLLIDALLDDFASADPSNSNSNSTSSADSRGKAKEEEVTDDDSCENAGRESGMTPRRGEGSENVGISMLSSPMTAGSGSASAGRFDEEVVEGLERMEIAFRLVADELDRCGKDVKLGNLEMVRKVATSQLKSLPGFLKVRYIMAFEL